MEMQRRRYHRRGITVIALVIVILILVVAPFLIPVPPLPNTLPPEALADPDSQFIDIDGTSVHVKTVGEGEPTFVLLHGFGASLYSWHAVTQAFSQLGQVIAFDRTGFGLTERPLAWEGENPYSPEAQVAQVIGLLDHFGIEKAILVGNSAGGTVSMQTALAHPERITALILVDPAVYSGGGAPDWMRPLLRTPQMRHLGPLIARQLLARGEELIAMAWHDPSLLQTGVLEMYKKPLQVENWDKALWEFTIASRSSDITNRLEEFNLPVLVISGDDDRIVPTSESIRLAGELPNAQLVVIPNAAHVPHEERPAEFMKAVNQFLQEISP
jgi:pimeloyl-ACP methyl ester carboxylesterase